MNLGLGLGISKSPIGATTLPVEVTYTDYKTVTGGFQTTRTFSGVSFGAAETNRKVLVFVGWDRAGSGFLDLTSVTIGGGLATKIGATYNNTDKAIAAYIADVPTGTTGDVVVEGSAWAVNISVYKVVNASSTVFATNGASGTTASLSTTINVAEKGGVIAAAYTTGAGVSTANYLWTGVTEQQDSLGANTARRQSSGLYTGNAETGRSIIANCSGSSSNDHALIALSLQP